MRRRSSRNYLFIVTLILLTMGVIYFIYSSSIEKFQNNTTYDIVIIAGQSNAQGNSLQYYVPNYRGMVRGTIYEHLYNNPYFQNDKLNNERPNNDSLRNSIFMFNHDNAVQVATDPIHHFRESGLKTNSKPQGFGIPFARQYVKEKGGKVLLLGCAMGGTSFLGFTEGTSDKGGKVYSWQEMDPSKPVCEGNRCSLFKMSKERIDNLVGKVASNSRVVAILWHQGENDYRSLRDNRDNRPRYKNGLSTMLKNLRSYAKTKFPSSDANFPILIGGLSPKGEPYNTVTPILREMANENSSSNFRFVPSDDSLGSRIQEFNSNLRPNNRTDTLHFSRMSIIDFGYRYYYVFNNNSINFR